MKRFLVLIFPLLLLGAGCSDNSTEIDGSISDLPSEFYSLMNWSHVPEGGVGTVADVTATASVLLHFEELDGNYSVEGIAEYLPTYFACSSSYEDTLCAVEGYTNGAVGGSAYGEDGVLWLELEWAGVDGALVLPMEAISVTTGLNDPELITTSQLQSTLSASGFIGTKLEIDYADKWFSDDYDELSEDGESLDGQDVTIMDLMGTVLSGTDESSGSGAGWMVFYREDPTNSAE
ncbi:hypothetical protein HON52_01960 [Candidatus Uhrbacteria bacterium]|jgi:hypothetical protein|nr:hypothetical protein [Candidatus Uhrbacteria bacterium]